MGANQSIEANLWSSTFQLQSKNSKLGMIKLTDKQTEDCYVCRKISTIDRTQMQQMDRLIDLKLSIQSPYITKLQRAETQQNRQYCTYGKNYFLLFKQPYQTLKQQTLNRKFKNATYTQTQIQLMLQIGVKALSFLKNIDHPHQNISSSSFFVNQNRSIILGDPFMFPKQNIPVTTRNGFIYPSPEMIKFQHNQIDNYNLHSSDLFTFGLVLMEVYFMENMDCVYQRYFERVDHDIVLKRINLFKSEQLRKKMFILLDPEAKNREIIYKYFVNSISSTDIFNRMPKDKFKKNIDRYNLATSQVTQWKNQLPLEPRLNSSEGKKSFSVSTTDHFLTEEKGFQYYERQYGKKAQPRANSSSQLYPPSQNQPKFINLNQRSHKNFNSNQSANDNKFNVSNSKTINGQSICNPRYVDPTYNQNSFRNIQSYSNDVTNPQLINTPINIDVRKSSEMPTQSNFRLYPLTTDLTFTKSYQVPSFNQNMPLVSTNNQNFYFHSSNTTQTIAPSYTEKYKYPQHQNFTLYQPKYEASLSQYKPFSIQSSVDIPRQYPSSYVPLIIQTQKLNDGQSKPINYPISSKQPEIYHLSITTQPKLEISSKATQSTQLETAKTQSQTSTLSVESQKKTQQLKPQQKKPSTTTPSKQRKRRHPSYGNLNHLSTINQRSQLTESMTSDISDRKSQILIEEDAQNNQQGQNKSQQNILPQLQKSVSGQNSESSEDNTNNKVWSIVYPSGTKYVGQIRNQKRNGLGTFYYIDGSKYHGNWLDNKMNGYGTLYYPTGKIAYQGQWKLDNFHGNGKVHNDEIPTFEGLYHYQNCQDIDNYWLQYQGELFQDRREGQGILRLANGQYFQGTFVNDQLNGLCKFYTKENIVIEGIWERNKMVRKIQEKQLTEEILKG